MKYVEQNGLRKLSPKFGYMLKNVKTGDIFPTTIYLGKHASIDDFEEIPNKHADQLLVNSIEEVEAKEHSLNKIGKLVASQVQDDVVALSIQEFYDIWQPGVAFVKGQYVNHNEVLYKVLQDHTSLDNWAPDVTGSLFAKVLVDPTGTTVLDWTQPDSTNPYMKGDKVKYGGLTYESTVDNNVWMPGVYGWMIVEG